MRHVLPSTRRGRGPLVPIAALAGLAVSGLLGSPIVAQDLDAASGAWGAHVGYHKAQDADEGNYTVGGHLELQLAPWLGLQGAVDYRDEDAFSVRVGGERETMQLRTVPITLSGRLYIPSVMSLSPFASAGVGWYRQIYDFPEAWEQNFGVDDRSETDFGWHLGLGARVGLGPRVSLYGEGRFIFMDPERDFGPDVGEQMENLDYDTTLLTGGVNLHF